MTSNPRPAIAALLAGVLALVPLANIAVAQTATISTTPQFQTCGDVHASMCMVYCRDNRNNADACLEDCRTRLEQCLGTTHGGVTGAYYWGNFKKFSGLRPEVKPDQKQVLKK